MVDVTLTVTISWLCAKRLVDLIIKYMIILMMIMTVMMNMMMIVIIMMVITLL